MPSPLHRLALRGLGIGLAFSIPNLGSARTTFTQIPDLPPSEAGQLLGEWVALCRAPNLVEMTRWAAANLSIKALERESAKDRGDDDFELCATIGPLRPYEVTDSSANAVTLLSVSARSGIWFEARFSTDKGGKLDQAQISHTEPPEAVLPADLSDAAIRTDLTSTASTLSRLGLFSGIVMVARGTNVIASASGGYADRSRETPITGLTQFTLGSLGKMFTAVAIGQLVDKGKLSFSDTVGTFFPNYPNQIVRDHVTVGMLLSHTSGMGDFLAKRTPAMMKFGVNRAAEFMPLYDADDLRFPPGTGWAYSNAGFALAGAIVEEVSGEAYPNYICRHIFAFAGMTDSDPNNHPLTSATLATPYTRLNEHGSSPDWRGAHQDIGSPAGGAISTADDLVRFAEALRSGKLVSKATLGEMTSPHGNMSSGEKYGYAMQIQEIYGRTVVGHGGDFPGVGARLFMLDGSPYTVVVLSNQDSPARVYGALRVVALMAEKVKLGK